MSLHHIHKGSELLLNAVLIKAGCLVIIAIIAFTFPIETTRGASVLVAFGGRVTSVIVCTCPANFGYSVTVAGQKGGQFFYSLAKTKKYAYYMPRPGGQIKGLAYPVYSPCFQVSINGCTPGGPGGLLMEKFGTNLR